MIRRTLAIALLVIPCLSLGAPTADKPPMPYNDWGACPFECCTYRDWVANAPITAFKSRDEKGAIAFQIEIGERINAITGVVVTRKPGITEIRKADKYGYLPDGKEPVLSLEPGEVVYTLHYVGEGYDLFWYKGKVYTDQISVSDNALGNVPNSDTVKIRSRPVYDWWAKIRNRSGQIGWTRKTNKFDNQDACG